MKQSAKPLIVAILIILLSGTALILATIGLRFKFEQLVRNKVKLEKILSDERTKKVNLIAEYQSFSTDERIILFAEEKLGLKKITEPKITVTINNNHINKLNAELKRKYE
jgi:hypothetical protein